MKDIYDECPNLEGKKFLLRLLKKEDADDLLKVYSDKKSVPYFNSDNCDGGDFYMDTIKNVKEAIKFWLIEYDRRGFVRFSIEDKETDQVIGTIELFNRKAEDFFNNSGILRLDLRSDYENKESIYDILEILIGKAYELFNCTSIATKAKSFADERIEALKEYGFTKTDQKLVGNDKTEYGDYWIISNK